MLAQETQVIFLLLLKMISIDLSLAGGPLMYYNKTTSRYVLIGTVTAGRIKGATLKDPTMEYGIKLVLIWSGSKTL